MRCKTVQKLFASMKTKPSALVVFIPGFPKNEDDSVCLPAQQSFIKNLRELYPLLKIIILSFQYPFEASEYKWKRVSVISFGGKNKGGLARLLLWNRVRRRFRSIQQEYGVRGILSFWLGECALVAKSLATKYRLPHYCWIMGQDSKADNKFVRRIDSQPGELIAISEFIAKEMKKNHGIAPSHIIPLGVDAAIYKSETLVRNVDLLGAGSLIALKQFEVFIRIVKKLSDENKNLRAVICGNGPEKDRLNRMIKDFGLSSNIQLLGERSHGEVVELMKRSRILLHPSSFEGFSGVCLEALGAGAHVVSLTRPMDSDHPHWYIARDEDDMVNITRELLNTGITHEVIIPYKMPDTVKAVMSLFIEESHAYGKHL
jgi:glycosyltransferase involved in cell wall biosynthesis